MPWSRRARSARGVRTAISWRGPKERPERVEHELVAPAQLGISGVRLRVRLVEPLEPDQALDSLGSIGELASALAGQDGRPDGSRLGDPGGPDGHAGDIRLDL